MPRRWAGALFQLRAGAPRFTARADVLDSLGLASVAQEANGHVIGRAVPADATGATAVPGVLVAGNVADLFAGVINAASAGLVTAAAINADPAADDVRYAVEAVSGTVTR